MGVFKRYINKIKRNRVFSLYKKAQNLIQKHTSLSYYKIYKKYEIGYAHEIIKWMFEDKDRWGGKMLDIGVAYGTMAVFAKQQFGFDVYTVDFVDRYAPQNLFKTLGIKFKILNIETESIPFDEKFDVITFTEVLEHFNFNPTPTLTKIKNVLAKNGVLYLSTPNQKYWGKRKISKIINIDHKSLDRILNGYKGYSYTIYEKIKELCEKNKLQNV
jgi:2-polyprenyl-3-methyl-5-hydroxy-6-metoxy-1,4-benzoquinol methylase